MARVLVFAALLPALAGCSITNEVAVDEQSWDDTTVCKVTSKTGSRVGEKTCKTGRQWRQAQIDKEEADKAAGSTPGTVFGDFEQVDIRD